MYPLSGFVRHQIPVTIVSYREVVDARVVMALWCSGALVLKIPCVCMFASCMKSGFKCRTAFQMLCRAGQGRAGTTTVLHVVVLDLTSVCATM